jgi:hypothetical protein
MMTPLHRSFALAILFIQLLGYVDTEWAFAEKSVSKIKGELAKLLSSPYHINCLK